MKRQGLFIDGNLILPASLQYADNLPFKFGSMGEAAGKSKEANGTPPLVLNFGTQPTNVRFISERHVVLLSLYFIAACATASD